MELKWFIGTVVPNYATVIFHDGHSQKLDVINLWPSDTVWMKAEFVKSKFQFDESTFGIIERIDGKVEEGYFFEENDWDNFDLTTLILFVDDMANKTIGFFRVERSNDEGNAVTSRSSLAAHLRRISSGSRHEDDTVVRKSRGWEREKEGE